MITWEEPDNFVSGEYVVVKAMTSEGTFYICVVLMEDPEIGKKCLCQSLETNQELYILIDRNVYMSEL